MPSVHSKIRMKKVSHHTMLVDTNHRNGAETLLTNFFHRYRIQRVLIALCDEDKYINWNVCEREHRQLGNKIKSCSYQSEHSHSSDGSLRHWS